MVMISATAVKDTALVSAFRDANERALRDLRSFQGYLDDLLPGSLGDVKLGLDLFEKKLQYREMCDVPLFRLERHADQELKRLQLSLQNTAAAIEHDRTPADQIRVLSIDYPKTDRLVAEADRLTGDVRAFCATKELFTIPDGTTCAAAPLEFGRFTRGMRLDPPPVFARSGRAARLEVALPPGSLKPLEADDFMRMYNRYQFPLLVAAHAWPGALLENDARSAVPSRLRRAFPFAMFTDGWSAYVRDALIEAGYAGGAPEYEMFRVRLDILDACRCLAAIRMHTATMSFDDVVAFFEKEALLSHVAALREARRVALDPMAVTSLLGRLQIVKLRDDFHRRTGPSFTPRAFHDGVLAFGAPSLRLLRQMLMPGDKGSVL